MPGLLRGVARTAVVAGTASAVNGRVQRRQAEKFADRDAQTAADRTLPTRRRWLPETPGSGARAGCHDGHRRPADALADLKDKGILTEEEFAAQKTKILAG